MVALPEPFEFRFNETLDFLEKLRPGGPWVLVRINPKAPRNTLGAIETITTSDLALARQFCIQWNGHWNLYFSVNPTRTAVSKKPAKTDIAKIEYLFADCDPAADEQPYQAHARYLSECEKKLPMPTFTLKSGNGLQFLWRLDISIELPEPVIDIESRKKTYSPQTLGIIQNIEARGKNILLQLGADVGTQNIDRILRLPGTTNVPDATKIAAKRIVCEAELLHTENVAYPFTAFELPEITNTQSGTGPTQRFEQEGPSSASEQKPVIPRHGITMLSLPNLGAGKKHADYATRSDLLFAFISVCRRAQVPDTFIIAACIDPQYKGNAIYEHCKEKGGNEYTRRQVTRNEEKQPQASASIPRIESVTAAELQQKVFPDIQYVVPSLIPEGVSMLAARPKIGKSWMALEISLALTIPSFMCLGDAKPDLGDVYYAALEDNERRLKRRIKKLLGTSDVAQWPSSLRLATTFPRLDKGGTTEIERWADTCKAPRLVILDTFARVKPIGSKRDGNAYSEDYESLAPLHRIASDRGLGVLVIHHQRKMEADDPIDSISGTLGIAGVVDTVLVIARTARGTTLYVRGRDVEEAEWALDFDKESCRWVLTGDAHEVQQSNQRQKILDALRNAPQGMPPKELILATGMKDGNLRQLLYSMGKDGQVYQQEGNYFPAVV